MKRLFSYTVMLADGTFAGEYFFSRRKRDLDLDEVLDTGKFGHRAVVCGWPDETCVARYVTTRQEP